VPVVYEEGLELLVSNDARVPPAGKRRPLCCVEAR
jgi:hypothetical protein